MHRYTPNSPINFSLSKSKARGQKGKPELPLNLSEATKGIYLSPSLAAVYKGGQFTEVASKAILPAAEGSNTKGRNDSPILLIFP